MTIHKVEDTEVIVELLNGQKIEVVSLEKKNDILFHEFRFFFLIFP